MLDIVTQSLGFAMVSLAIRNKKQAKSFSMAHPILVNKHCLTLLDYWQNGGAKEHEAIALIQQMKADGANLQAIADELNNQGITTKRGCQWQPMQVSRVLARG